MFKDGDLVQLKDIAVGWVEGAKYKQYIVGGSKFYDKTISYTVKECVKMHPDDFELVKKSPASKYFVKEMKPHKHAELIKKWADGAKIQLLTLDPRGVWVDDMIPAWNTDITYRVEPAKREFPKTSLQFSALYEEGKKGHSGIEETMLIANLAIKQYILDTEKENGAG